MKVFRVFLQHAKEGQASTVRLECRSANHLPVSATEHLGSPVRAVVSEPLFSADHRLILSARMLAAPDSTHCLTNSRSGT
jgi:hypothetical protein